MYRIPDSLILNIILKHKQLIGNSFGRADKGLTYKGIMLPLPTGSTLITWRARVDIDQRSVLG